MLTNEWDGWHFAIHPRNKKVIDKIIDTVGILCRERVGIRLVKELKI